MISIREAIQRVLSAYGKGVQSRDTRLSKRHVYSKLVSARERVLAQEYKKNQKVSQWSYQTLPCVEMVSIPIIECPCVPPLGRFTLRSKYLIPAIITGMDDHAIQSVMSLDGETKYDETQWESKKNKKGAKYTSKATDWYIKNSYLYLTATRKPEKVVFTAIASNPMDFHLFKTCCEDSEPCFNILDKSFHIEGDSFEAVIELAVAELIALFAKMPEDKTSNTSDDAEG